MRRLLILAMALVVGLPLLGLHAQPAAAFGPHLTVKIEGAGIVREITPAQRMNCSSPPTTPTGTIGAQCTAHYGWTWIIELEAIAHPGYTFQMWQGIYPRAVGCDGADASYILRFGTCKFQAWTPEGEMTLVARFADTEAPETTITSGPGRFTNSHSASFTYAATQETEAFQCRVDAASFSTCSGPGEYATTGATSYTELADGRHTIEVRAVDPSGNVDPSPARRTWHVDTVEPSAIVIVNDGARTTPRRSVHLTLAASDPSPGSGVVQMRLRNAGTTKWSPWQAFAIEMTWTLTAGAGTKRVEVQVRDRAGNISAIAADTITFQP